MLKIIRSIVVALLLITGAQLGLAKELTFPEADPRFTGGEFHPANPSQENFWFYNQYNPARQALQQRGVRLNVINGEITLAKMVWRTDAFYFPTPTNPAAATYPLTDAEISAVKAFIADAPYTGGRSVIFNLSNGVSAAMLNDLLMRLGLSGHMSTGNVTGNTTYPLPNHPIMQGPYGVPGSFTMSNSGHFDALGGMRSLMNVNGKAVVPYVEKGDLTARSGAYFFLLHPDFVKGFANQSPEQQKFLLNLIDYATEDQVFHYHPPAPAPAGSSITVLNGAAELQNGTGLLDFGTTPPGSPITRSIVIKNTGAAPLTLGTLSALPTGFSVVTSYNSPIAVGDNTTLTLKLNAAAIGNYSGQISFLTNDPDNGTFSFRLAGLVSIPGSTRIIDDRDSGWSSSGGWGFTVEAGRYYLDDHSFAVGGKGSNACSYTFTSLPPGVYRVSATWRGDTNRATNSPFTIRDGGTTLATVRINQRANPASFSEGGVAWGDIGQFNVSSGTLVVSLTDDADQYVDADAVRVEKVADLVIGPEIQVLDGTTDLTSVTGKVDFGATAPGSPRQKMLTIKNNGNANLTLGAIATLPAGFTVATPFGATSVAPGASTSLVLQFNGTTPGNYGGTFSFANNDADEPNFSLTITGAVIAGGAVRIVDDNDSGFTKSGSWGSSNEPGRYYNNDHSFAKGGSGFNTATYTFTGLTPGSYRVSATWRGDVNRVTDAPFTVADGSTILGTVKINQQAQPASLLDQNTAWGDIGTFNVTGSTLVVTLKDTATPWFYVDADAVRIERVGDLNAPPPNPPAPAQVFYVDDRGQGWTGSGSWGYTSENIYYNGGHSFAKDGNGANVATYTFNNLAPGKYKVSATWRGDTNRAANANFTLHDGGNTLSTVIVNQQQQPNSILDKGLAWGNLATVTITGNSLVVKLSDLNVAPGMYVDADGIRIEVVP